MNELLDRIPPGLRPPLLWIGVVAVAGAVAVFLNLYLGLAMLPFAAFGILQTSSARHFDGVAIDESTRLGREAAAPLPIHGGALAWDPPGTMRVGKEERISIRIGDDKVALAALLDGLRERDIVVAPDVPISGRMRVRLLADAQDFAVDARSSEDQLILPGQPARWDFDVTPRRSGLRRLRLLASMRTVIDGKEEVADLPAYEKEVTVAVAPLHSAGRFLRANWKWLATALILPALGWLFANSGLGENAARAIKAWLH